MTPAWFCRGLRHPINSVRPLQPCFFRRAPPRTEQTRDVRRAHGGRFLSSRGLQIPLSGRAPFNTDDGRPGKSIKTRYYRKKTRRDAPAALIFTTDEPPPATLLYFRTNPLVEHSRAVFGFEHVTVFVLRVVELVHRELRVHELEVLRLL